MRLIIFLCVFFMGALQVNLVAAQVQLAERCWVSKVNKGLVCDIRLRAPRPYVYAVPKKPKKVKVTWTKSGTKDDASFELYNPNAKTTAWMLLIDRSKSMQKKTLKLIREDFGKVIGKLSGERKMGVYTFAAGLDEPLAMIGAPQAQLEKALKDMKATGSETALYSSSMDALRVLDQFAADRKALVIVSDGQAEDTAYTRDDVIKLANDLKITIYGIGYSQGAGKKKFLQNLQRMADDTKGYYDEAVITAKTKRLLSTDFADNFLLMMENGGTVTFPLRDTGDKVSFDMDVLLAGGEKVTQTLNVPIKAQGVWYTLAQYAQRNPAPVYGGGAALLVLLGLATFFLLRHRPEEPEIVDAGEIYMPGGVANPQQAAIGPSVYGDTSAGQEATSIGGMIGSTERETKLVGNASSVGGLAPTGASKSAYAWLTSADNPSHRIAVNETTMRIGRHGDNDIKFDDNSVHRRHAILHITPQREFILTDLSGESGNGVVINAERVDKKELADGDLIELGNIRVRFEMVPV